MRKRGVARSAARVASTVTVVMVACAAFGGAAYAQKIGPSANPLTLTEGQSQGVQFVLDEPIIAPSPNPDVTINFTVDDPSRVSLSNASLEWPYNEWYQPRSLTVSALHDGVHDVANTVVVHFVAVSASQYFNGYSGSLSVTINDIDPAPTTTTAPTASTTVSSSTTSTAASTTSTTVARSTSSVATDPSTTIAKVVVGELPRTGSTSTVPVAGGALLAAGSAILALARRRRAATWR